MVSIIEDGGNLILIAIKKINQLKAYLLGEFLVKIDHVYYSRKAETYVIAFRIKCKRGITKLNLDEVTFSRELLRGISPSDNYILGKILNCQHNAILDNRIYTCNTQENDSADSLVHISKIDFINNTLTLRHTKSTITKSLHLAELKNNFYIISSLSNEQAFAVGYRLA